MSNKNKILLRALGSVESNNNPKAMNKKSSATGEIQMMWSQWGKKIKKFAGNPNLTREDFANDTDLQNRWAEHYVENVLKPEANKLQQRYPEQIKEQGLSTPEDVQTLIHFQGYPRSSKFLRSGTEAESTQPNLSIPEYLKRARKKREELSVPPTVPNQKSPAPVQAAPNIAHGTPILQFKPDERSKKSLMDNILGVLSNLFVSEAEGSGGSAKRALPSNPDDEEIENEQNIPLVPKPKGVTPPLRPPFDYTTASTVDSGDVELPNPAPKESSPASSRIAANQDNMPAKPVTPPLRNVESQSGLQLSAKSASSIPPGFTPEEWDKEQEAIEKNKETDRKKALYPEYYSSPMGKSEAAWRGAVQSAMFEFGDEVSAMYDWARNSMSGKEESFETTLEKARIPYERAAKEQPETYYPVSIISAIVTSMTPQGKWIGNARKVQLAANLVRGLKTAGTVGTELKTAQTALRTAQLGSMARQAGLTALGASEKKDVLGVAEDVALGTAVGTGVGYGIGKATDMLINSPTVQKVASKAWETGKNILLGPSKKWKLDPSHFMPNTFEDVDAILPTRGDLNPRYDIDYNRAIDRSVTKNSNILYQGQKIVDEILAAGKEQNLTEQQMLNLIVKRIPELNPTTINSLINPSGIRQGLKNVIAGSSKASQLIGNEEQRVRAERLATETGAESPEMAKAIQQQEQAKSALDVAKQYRTNMMEQNQQVKQEVANEIKLVNDQLSKEKDTIKLNALRRRRSALIQKADAVAELLDKQNKINALENTIEEQQKFAMSAVDRLQKQRTAQHLGDVKNLASKLEEQVVDLAGQRTTIVNNLESKEATSDMLAAYQSVNDAVNAQIDKAGMRDIRNKFFEYAFAGDPRVSKINRHLKALKDVAENLEIEKFNKSNPDKAKDLLQINQEDLKPPTAKDLVESLLIANKKISSADHGNPAASIKRELGEILQEHMRLIDEDVYIVQRGIANTKSNLKTIYSSGLFSQRYVPKTGKTGRTQAVRTPFIKKDIPDFTQVSDDYIKILKDMGVPAEDLQITSKLKQTPQYKNAEAMDFVESLGFGKSAADTESAKKSIAEATKNISNLKTEITSLERFKENLRRDLKLQSGIDRQRTIELEQEANKRIEFFNNKLKEQEALFKQQDFAASQVEKSAEEAYQGTKGKVSTLGQTEAELKDIYKETTGLPATARDVGQIAVIGAKGQIPFGVGKLIPSPKTRIKLVNKLERNFRNPSLNAATRAILSQPVTSAIVRSLAQTHNVDINDLIKTFQEAGVEIVPDEGD